MGANPYWYYVPYNPNINAALHELRQREFEAGRYNPVIPFMEFPLDATAPSPGSRHASIDEAREAAAEDGTRSILDIDRIGDAPELGVATPLDEATLDDLFETATPTREMVEQNLDFFDNLERGHAVYFV